MITLQKKVQEDANTSETKANMQEIGPCNFIETLVQQYPLTALQSKTIDDPLMSRACAPLKNRRRKLKVRLGGRGNAVDAEQHALGAAHRVVKHMHAMVTRAHRDLCEGGIASKKETRTWPTRRGRACR